MNGERILTASRDIQARTGRAVFISYAHADNESSDSAKRWLDRLLTHLQPVGFENELIAIATDKEIDLGDDWHEHIQSALKRSAAAVLLVSPAFLASKYIRNNELPVLLHRARTEGLLIIPVILRPCLFAETHFKFPDPSTGPEKFSLASLQAAGSPAKALNEMDEAGQDRALLEVARRIKKWAEDAPGRTEDNTYRPGDNARKADPPSRQWSLDDLTALIDKKEPALSVLAAPGHHSKAFLVYGRHEDWPDAVANSYSFARDKANYNPPVLIQTNIVWTQRYDDQQILQILTNAIGDGAGQAHPVYCICVGLKPKPRAELLARVLLAWEKVPTCEGEKAHALMIALTKFGPTGTLNSILSRWAGQRLLGAVRKSLKTAEPEQLIGSIKPVTPADLLQWPYMLQKAFSESCPACIKKLPPILDDLAADMPEAGLAHRSLAKMVKAALNEPTASR